MTTARTWAVLDSVRALAPEIGARAGEIASLRRLPADLVASLKASGAFSMPMPREQCEVYEVLGAADPAVAWCV